MGGGGRDSGGGILHACRKPHEVVDAVAVSRALNVGPREARFSRGSGLIGEIVLESGPKIFPVVRPELLPELAH